MSDMVYVREFPPCDICATVGASAAAAYDGKTTIGPWAHMCEAHFMTHGVGLGIGKGQRLRIREATPTTDHGLEA